MSITANFGGKSVLYSVRQPPRPAGKFGVVNLDYDQEWLQDDGSVIKKVSRPTRNGNTAVSVTGLPATARFPVAGSEAGTVLLYEALEKWMYVLCLSASSIGIDESKKSWRSLLSGGSAESGKSARFFSDYAGTETNRSFVLGTNPDSEPIKVKPMVCGGTIVKIIGDGYIGEPVWRIEAIDPLRFQDADVDKNWWLLFYPTNSVRKAIYTYKNSIAYFDYWLEYISEPFHQFDTHARLPIFGLAGKSYNFIQKSRVRVLSEHEETPSPYIRSVVTGYETPFYPSPYSGSL